jgi:hypothetical protein
MHMATTQGSRQPTFRVLDAMDAPHGGRIVRLRLQSGEAPSIRSLKGARLRATGPAGATTTLAVRGFAVFGGKPTNERLSRTGRIDLHVDEVSGPPVGLRWEIQPE